MNTQNSNSPVTLNDRVKKAALFSIIGHAILILLAVAILFIPIFSYTATVDMNSNSIEDLLAVCLWEENVHGTDYDNPTGSIEVEVGSTSSGVKTTYTDKGNFSYFNDMVRCVDTVVSFFSGSLESDENQDEVNPATFVDALVAFVASFLMIFVLVCLILMVVFAVKSIIKDVAVLQNPDKGIADRKYQIANPKPVKVDAKGRKKASMDTAGDYAKAVAYLAVVDIVLCVVMNMMMGINAASGMTGVLLFLSRFMGHISGVSLGIIPVVILAVGAIVILVQLKKMNQDITNELTD